MTQSAAIPKKRIATVWLCGCSGCHMSLLDLDERLIDLAGMAEFVASPIMDDEEIPECDIGLVEGSVANEENLEVLHRIPQQAKVLRPLGDSAGSVACPCSATCSPSTTSSTTPTSTWKAPLSRCRRPGKRSPWPDAQGPPHPRTRPGGRVDPRLPALSPDAIWNAVKALLTGRPTAEPVVLSYD